MKQSREISKSKKRIFWLITFLLPIIFFLLLETGLRLFDYGGNLNLFIEGPKGYENYLRLNPNVARRYFYQEDSVPTPPKQLFLKSKTENTFRIFVLGGSTTAGFPYGNNASFPNFLQRVLASSYPEKNIEVINVAMAAVNSYTLLDLTNEILEQAPDLLLIYAGHNEYYGALGIGSVQSLGSWRGLINSYLSLQTFRTFIFLRDVIGWVKIILGKLTGDETTADPSATLMARIVAEQTIPYKSELYELGKAQFKGNIEEIIKKVSGRGVEVILSELVSNLRDQKPFISIEKYNGASAEEVYIGAQASEAAGDYAKAIESYKLAKDVDALRFRAPEEFNEILNNLSEKYSCPIVRLLTIFEQHSPNGLIGESLILEHLHPNISGYQLIGSSFYELLANEKIIGSLYDGNVIQEEAAKGTTDLDSVYGAMVVKHLKHSWPFRPKEEPNRFLETYSPVNKLEEIALKIITTRNYTIESGHIELSKYYEQQGNVDKAVQEYEALIASIPHESEFYENAATLLILDKKYDKAEVLLRQSLKYNNDYFAYKWIGQIALMKNNYKTAIEYLSKADAVDQQVIFNLARAYYSDGQLQKGEEYYLKMKNAAPNSEYARHLSRLRTLAFINQKVPLPK